jgi:hypothetical protein
VPSHHCFRLHEDEDFDPARPAAAKDDPEPAVDCGDARTPTGVNQHCELLTEGEVLQDEVGSRSNECADSAEQEQEEANDEPSSLYASATKTSIIFS